MTLDSLRARLSLWITGLVLCVTAIAGAFAWWSAAELARERQDENIAHLAALIAGGRLEIVPGAGASAPSAELLDDEPLDREFRLAVHELGSDAVAGAGTAHRVSELAGLDNGVADGLQMVTLDGEEWRVFVGNADARGRRIAVGQPTSERDEEMHIGGLRTVVPLLVLVPVLLLVITDLIARLLTPVRTLADALDARQARDLSPLDHGKLPSEIRPFVSALDRLLARARDAASVQRRFVADAAHELRTPLTALSLQAERLLATSDLSDEARARAQALLSGIERAQNLMRQLLALARAQDGLDDDAGHEPVPLERVARRVIEDQLSLALERGIDIGVTRIERVTTSVSESELTVLLGNLVGNAVRYSPTGGRVDIAAWRDRNTAMLSVTDTGPGIPIESRERVFDAFYREPGSLDIEGSGLGLSIVRAIADRYGATVQLADGDNSVGLRVTVILPSPTT